MKCTSDLRISISIDASSKALPEAGECEKLTNAPVWELVTILGVNGFASHEVNVKARVLDSYMLLLRALEVHLDPRLNGIPQHAMTEAIGVKVGSQFSIEAMQDV